MTTKYIGKKTTVRDSFKEYADKKLAKLDKFFETNDYTYLLPKEVTANA